MGHCVDQDRFVEKGSKRQELTFSIIMFQFNVYPISENYAPLIINHFLLPVVKGTHIYIYIYSVHAQRVAN